jgi:hypothetical protein
MRPVKPFKTGSAVSVLLDFGERGFSPAIARDRPDTRIRGFTIHDLTLSASPFSTDSPADIEDTP